LLQLSLRDVIKTYSGNIHALKNFRIDITTEFSGCWGQMGRESPLLLKSEKTRGQRCFLAFIRLFSIQLLY